MKLTRKRRDAVAESRSLAESLRAWRDYRIRAAAKRAEERAIERAKRQPDGSRGVDRVPSYLRSPAVPHRSYEWIHEHTGRMRFTPYMNPAKDRSLRGKARRQARKAARR